MDGINFSFFVGSVFGTFDESIVGNDVGISECKIDGCPEGTREVSSEGIADRNDEGNVADTSEGRSLSIPECCIVGIFDRTSERISVGFTDG